MSNYDKMHVFDKVPIAQCWERTGKAPLKERWIDIDKGTRYRSRWTQVRPDTLKRMYVTRRLGRKCGPTPGCPGCATIGSPHQASHSDARRDRMRAELEKSEEGREHLAREQARVDAKRQTQSSASCPFTRKSTPAS